MGLGWSLHSLVYEFCRKRYWGSYLRVNNQGVQTGLRRLLFLHRDILKPWLSIKTWLNVVADGRVGMDGIRYNHTNRELHICAGHFCIDNHAKSWTPHLLHTSGCFCRMWDSYWSKPWKSRCSSNQALLQSQYGFCHSFGSNVGCCSADCARCYHCNLY